MKAKSLKCLTTLAPAFCILSPPQALISALGSFLKISLIKLDPCKSPDASPAIT